jgi:hypothetical protein
MSEASLPATRTLELGVGDGGCAGWERERDFGEEKCTCMKDEGSVRSGVRRLTDGHERVCLLASGNFLFLACARRHRLILIND